ncbi:uncharacterized protein LOC6524405 [Drosophila yakuba]|uniref:Uncharacterized protein n=1 Tax=Drosophila yakuba TaxID=7245 RepID=B4Q164_DROYA|nr:uncharacterized protein LOC6524405 [Drosophila yakuba]EDX01371.1 uncharacterized protein Dyak_GE16948 [Drosophila yakuba]
MLKWTASAQRLNEIPVHDEDANQQRMPAQRSRLQRRQRRQRRATIANKENVPDTAVGYTSTPVPMAARLLNSPLVLAPLSDIRNVTPEAVVRSQAPQRVQSVRYATTLPRFAEDYSPNGLPSGQHLALRGLAPLDPFLGQPRYIVGAGAGGGVSQLKQRRLDADFVATLEPELQESELQEPPVLAKAEVRPSTPQPASSTQMGDQTLDRLIDAILDSACKANASSKKKPRRSTFNLRRRTLVKQQMESHCPQEVLSPSYAPGDDPAADLSFGLMPLPVQSGLLATPEPASPLAKMPHNLLVQLATPVARPMSSAAKPAPCDNTFCLETPLKALKRSRKEIVAKESPIKRYKVDERNYFEVGLALPSSIYV